MKLLESGLQDMAHLASSLAMKQNPKSLTSASILGRQLCVRTTMVFLHMCKAQSNRI